MDRAGGQPETATLNMVVPYLGLVPKASPTQGQGGGAQIAVTVMIFVAAYLELS